MKTFIYAGKVIIIELELEISYWFCKTSKIASIVVEQQYAWCY